MQQQQSQSDGPEHAKQLRAVASAKAAQAVRDIVEGFGEQTVRPVRTRSLTWPGVNSVEPEPIACLEVARELERAAHAVQLDYVHQARDSGRSWYEIGEALDLHWAASANKESIVVEAYDYALELGRCPGLGRPPLTWMCPACQQTITDQGPYGDLPQQQDGHTGDCPRWAAEVADWQKRHSAR